MTQAIKSITLNGMVSCKCVDKGAHGSCSWQKIVQRLELWRLVTAPFVFPSIPELFLGIYLMYFFRVFERQVGSIKYLVGIPIQSWHIFVTGLEALWISPTSSCGRSYCRCSSHIATTKAFVHMNLIVFAICWGIYLGTSHLFTGGFLWGQLDFQGFLFTHFHGLVQFVVLFATIISTFFEVIALSLFKGIVLSDLRFLWGRVCCYLNIHQTPVDFVH